MNNHSETNFQSYDLRPVAIVKSCFKGRFGIPRQPGLIPESRGFVRFLPPFNQPNAVRGLEKFSHIWLIFVFHASLRSEWKATVRPPRLGGDTRVGVFASRSPFRPCPIGLSVVKLEGIHISGHGSVKLEVSGLDLLDETPILDIKPYLPYTDIIHDASGGFALNAPDAEKLQLEITEKVQKNFDILKKAGREDLVELIKKMISADPRPAYQKIPNREYSIFVEDYEVVWIIGENLQVAEIIEIKKA